MNYAKAASKQNSPLSSATISSSNIQPQKIATQNQEKMVSGDPVVSEALREVVRAVLNAWPAYQFAICQQTVGTVLTTERDVDFCDDLVHLLHKKSRELSPSELADMLEEVIRDDFDLLVEDGTLRPTADLLLRLAGYVLDRKNPIQAQTDLQAEMAQLCSFNEKQANIQGASAVAMDVDEDEELSPIEESDDGDDEE